MTDHAALTRYGFSAAKAAEIVLDAKRGGVHSKRAVGIARYAADESRRIPIFAEIGL